MLRRMAIALGALLCAAPAAAEPVVAAYYAASGDAAKAAAIPAERLTHLLYAFAPVCGDAGRKPPPECAKSPAGAVVLPDDAASRREIAALKALKWRNPRLRLLLSVGGWNMQAYPGVIADPMRRDVFARSLAGLMGKHRELDGVDVDWEFPGGGDAVRPSLTGAALAQERADYTALMGELREALDEVGTESRTLELAAAVVGYDRAITATDWRTIAPLVDQVFVMAYDFTPEREFRRRGDFSGGGGLPGHHAAVRAAGDEFGADAMVDRLVAAGVPAGKLVLGVGFYAREWAGAKWAAFPARATAGRFVGTTPWRELDLAGRARRGQRPGRDERAGASYLSAPDGAFVSYEDPWSICAKGRYAAERGLGGLFAWEAGQDDGRLTAAMQEAARGGC